MSANEWSVCPACKQNQNKKRNKLLAEVQEKYGKISAKEYQTLINNLPPEVEELESTLREDWEIGTYEGEFYVNYSSSCTMCDYKFHYDYSVAVP